MEILLGSKWEDALTLDSTNDSLNLTLPNKNSLWLLLYLLQTSYCGCYLNLSIPSQRMALFTSSIGRRRVVDQMGEYFSSLIAWKVIKIRVYRNCRSAETPPAKNALAASAVKISLWFTWRMPCRVSFSFSAPSCFVDSNLRRNLLSYMLDSGQTSCGVMLDKQTNKLLLFSTQPDDGQTNSNLP